MYTWSVQLYDVDNCTRPCGILHKTNKNLSWEIYLIPACERLL